MSCHLTTRESASKTGNTDAFEAARTNLGAASSTDPDLLLPQPSADPRPPRPAWVEVDLGAIMRNYARIKEEAPSSLTLLAVVKDDAYGHGAVPVARLAIAAGVRFLAVATLEEGIRLREAGLRVPILLLGEREPAEFPWAVRHDLTCVLGEPSLVRILAKVAAEAGKRVPIHVKINTGMNRYGVRWDAALAMVEQVLSEPALALEGVLSHFAQSDEADKTFARLQLQRFQQVLCELEARGIRPAWRHLCNTGGYLDLPEAHFDLVRLGLLPLGVYPSRVCRRLAGLEPAMAVKARIVAIQHLRPGDTVGYGMHYRAESPRRIAVLPLGYGDGFPRVRNAGYVLIRGRRAPLVGGVAMDAFAVDITDIPEVSLGDEAVIMGCQGTDRITARDLADLRQSVVYEALVSWQPRLPRVYRISPTA
ncbi:MAG: alanine racemase [Verrucomicrobiota bacterium]|nr:alanine racemase [Limisphaera sp.]MDW8380941.1 alanine racemase [Verrucomicrobiota bacterium]